MMGDLGVEEELFCQDGFKQFVMVKKNNRTICSTQCLNPPANTPSVWNITNIVRQEKLDFLSELSHCLLRRSPENSHQIKEWEEFLGFLQKHKRVATVKHECFEFFILPPKEGSGFSCTFACYRYRGKPSECPVDKGSGSTSHVIEDAWSPYNQEAIVAQTCDLSAKASGRPEKTNLHNLSPESNFVHANPSFLKTLGHTHSGWSFGAIAEFVDNSRDAKATKLEISIDMIFSRAVDREIPMLCIIDDGCGMNHQKMLQMVSFGHKQPDVDDPDRIGRFGIGFKTGAMKLGKDALVLTQTTNSRSIAFLSQTLNEGKDNLEIPIVSYYRYGQFMELDKQNETLFKHNLKAIKEFSPFDKYFIGQKAYKRVGSMMHNGDKGHGVIGVIDVTNLMAEDSGHVWVHNNKQGFQDCEAYAELEKWLGEKSDKYLDEHIDKVELKVSNGIYKPDNEWVQCDKCRKWRMFSHGFNSKTLPLQWFCYMKPFNGKCEIPEQKVEPGVITISSKRLGYSSTEDPEEIKRKLSRQAAGTLKNMDKNVSSHTKDDDQAEDSYAWRHKRLRRSCRRS